MTDIISASNITVTRDNKDILDNVSISVNSDDFITILGPNGAGKSMLLKCLMGFYKPEKGMINRTPNLRIGYVPQQFVSEQTLPISTKRFLALRKKVEEEEI